MGQKNQRTQSALRRRCLETLLLCVAIYVLAGVGCATFQRRLIYFPTVFTSERAEALARAEHLERWTVPGGKAIGWRRLSPVQPARSEERRVGKECRCRWSRDQ